MMQRILFILLFILCFCSPAVVHAGKPSNRTISIVVTDVSISDTAKPVVPTADNRAVNPSARIVMPPHIAITYEITNSSTTRKPTLDQNRKTRLIDEFGNEYRQIKLPNINQFITRMPKNFPSLYPGDTYTTTVFFETPIPAAKKLKFICSAVDLGLTKPIDLFIDITDRSTVTPIQIKDNDQPALGIRIVDPPSGTILNQGDVVHIRIMAKGDKPPKKIIVITLNTYFEDKAPGLENVYDLNVPLNQTPGNYLVNVIAEWPGTTAENNITLSDTLSFDVRETVPLPSL
jgi:hypothetical protein